MVNKIRTAFRAAWRPPCPRARAASRARRRGRRAPTPRTTRPAPRPATPRPRTARRLECSRRGSFTILTILQRTQCSAVRCGQRCNTHSRGWARRPTPAAGAPRDIHASTSCGHRSPSRHLQHHTHTVTSCAPTHWALRTLSWSHSMPIKNVQFTQIYSYK